MSKSLKPGDIVPHYCQDLWEWIGDDWRFGIAVEDTPEDSSWYLVVKIKDKLKIIESGLIGKRLWERLYEKKDKV